MFGGVRGSCGRTYSCVKMSVGAAGLMISTMAGHDLSHSSIFSTSKTLSEPLYLLLDPLIPSSYPFLLVGSLPSRQSTDKENLGLEHMLRKNVLREFPVVLFLRLGGHIFCRRERIEERDVGAGDPLLDMLVSNLMFTEVSKDLGWRKTVNYSDLPSLAHSHLFCVKESPNLRSHHLSTAAPPRVSFLNRPPWVCHQDLVKPI